MHANNPLVHMVMDLRHDMETVSSSALTADTCSRRSKYEHKHKHGKRTRSNTKSSWEDRPDHMVAVLRRSEGEIITLKAELRCLEEHQSQDKLIFDFKLESIRRELRLLNQKVKLLENRQCNENQWDRGNINLASSTPAEVIALNKWSGIANFEGLTKVDRGSLLSSFDDSYNFDPEYVNKAPLPPVQHMRRFTDNDDDFSIGALEITDIDWDDRGGAPICHQSTSQSIDDGFTRITVQDLHDKQIFHITRPFGISPKDIKQMMSKIPFPVESESTGKIRWVILKQYC